MLYRNFNDHASIGIEEAAAAGGVLRQLMRTKSDCERPFPTGGSSPA
ncbi:hypothetical protein CHELA17_63661 [Chelatococcus asaccharovorans]|nr:hypothetical protein CHELA17_63661 [Chelatococcus asaccharovorans]